MRENLENLIKGGIPPKKLAKETDIPTATCYRFLNGEASIDNISFKTAEKLNEYYTKYVLQNQH